MKVSVIIPTLNEEKYIEPTLKALKKQSLNKKEYEIIICDSYSKDKTVDIAGKYGTKIILTNKKGAGAARNLAARKANGDILVFIDADTIVEKNFLKEVVNAFKDTEVIGGTCRFLPISTKEEDIIMYNIFAYVVKKSIERDKKKKFCPGFCCFYKKDIFNKIKGFKEDVIAEDHELARRISKHGKLVFLDNTFIYTSSRRINANPAKWVSFYLNAFFRDLLTRRGINVATWEKYPEIRGKENLNFEKIKPEIQETREEVIRNAKILIAGIILAVIAFILLFI